MKFKILLPAFLIIIIPLRMCAQKLVKVAASDYQWTGIAVSHEGRIFVNYPTWNISSPYKVAELINGKEVAYPSAEDNKLFVCIQSVIIDDHNRLWILDPANPGFKGVVKEGPKLYCVDISSNKIVKTYSFSANSYTDKSYLNDIRIDTKSEVAYITDSTIGGIVVLDLLRGTSWRALDSNCTAVLANLDSILFKSTGKSTSVTHSDGIELSKDQKTLYFSALTGTILYQVPTDILKNKNISSQERCAKVSVINKSNVPTDGMLLYEDKLYMANLPDESVWQYDIKNGNGHQLNFGEKIRWADSFSHGSDGYIYFTTSQINYPVKDRSKYEIFKFKP